MSLSCYEYFRNNKHIKELQNLNNDKLYYLIQEFYKEIEKLNNIKQAQLKDLKKLCDEVDTILKKIGFILMSYKIVYQKDYYNAKEREAINDIFYEMDKINFFITNLKNLKINGMKVKKLVNDLLIFIRLLNLTISELNNN